VREVEDTAAAPRAVVAFPHGPHVAAGAKCTDCHTLGAGGADVATKPEALACNQCHDHRDGGPRAERLFGEQVQSCARCHHDDAAAGANVAPPAAAAPGTANERERAPGALAIPAVRGSEAAASDPRYRATQSTFAGFADSQFHPLGGACTDCHRAALAPDPKWPGLRVPRADHLFGRSKSPHAGQVAKRPADCLRCHWKPIDGLEAGVDAVDARLRTFRQNPTSPATRAEFGNDAVGYPGTDKARG
jgi:hypothetical protein